MNKFLEAAANVFRIPDLRNRVLFTLAMLAVYRLGGHIPTPGIDAAKLEQLAGFRGLYLLRRRGLEESEFLVLTLWDSMDAVHAFAGDQPERAVVEPEARAALVRFDDTVSHYEVLAAPEVAG